MIPRPTKSPRDHARAGRPPDPPPPDPDEIERAPRPGDEDENDTRAIRAEHATWRDPGRGGWLGPDD